VDLSGWKLGQAVQLTFPAGTSLRPGEHLVAGSDREHLLRTLGLDPSLVSCVGNWTGALPHGKGTNPPRDRRGERGRDIYLRGRKGFLRPSRRHGAIPRAAQPASAGRLRRNWGAANPSAGWVRLEATGIAPSSRMYLYLLGEGTAYVDDIVIRPFPRRRPGRRSRGAVEPIRIGFEDDALEITRSGNHSESEITAETAHGGKRCLKLRATGPGSSLQTSVSAELKGSPGWRALHARVLGLLPRAARAPGGAILIGVPHRHRNQGTRLFAPQGKEGRELHAQAAKRETAVGSTPGRTKLRLLRRSSPPPSPTPATRRSVRARATG